MMTEQRNRESITAFFRAEHPEDEPVRILIAE